MKKIVFMLCAAAALMTSVSAQNKKTHVTGYGGGIAEVTTINGKAGFTTGGLGGVLLNHKWLIGVSGHNTFFRQNVNGSRESFQFMSYGLYNEFRINPSKGVHAAIGLSTGLGSIQKNTVNGKREYSRDGKWVYTIQPKLALTVPVTRFMQVQAQASYRFTGNTESTYYSSNNVNGVSGGITLLFGGF